MKNKIQLTRRDFFVTSSGAALAGLIGFSPTSSNAAALKKRVVLVRNSDVIGTDGQLNDEVLHRMLNQAVTRLYEIDDAGEAWRKLIAADDVVGIKSNEWGRLPTPEGLEQAIRSELLGAGVPEDKVSISDRGVRSDPVFQNATALVNVRPMRTHHWSGLGTCLKNPITFVPRPSEYHADACASLGALWHLPQVKGRVRLNILVMLTPQFHGVGPHSFSKEFVWPYYGLIVALDPVPVDATGARIIQAKRNEYFGKESPIKPSPHHIQVADTKYGLGTSDPDAIELVRIGERDGSLI
jgi:hypothetical protein